MNTPTPDFSPEETIEQPVEKPKKRNIKKYIFSFLFMLALIGLTFYLILKDNSLAEIKALLSQVKPGYVAGGIAAMMLYLLFHAFTFGVAAKTINIRLRLKEMMDYSLVGHFYSSITPSSTGGQPMQFYYMSRDRIAPSKVTLILFQTNIAYQAAAVIVGIAMFIYQRNYIAQLNTAVLPFFILGVVCSLAMLSLLICVVVSERVLRSFLSGIVRFLAVLHLIKNKEKWQASIDRYIIELKTGMALLKTNRRRFFDLMLVSFVMIFFYQISPYFAYKAFGLHGYSLMEIYAVSMVLYMSVAFLPLPGTVGAAESGFLLLFKPMFASLVLPAMLLSRFMSFYVLLVVCGIACAYVHFRKPHNTPANKKFKG